MQEIKNTKPTFKEFLSSQIRNGRAVYLDGGMGTMIQEVKGLSYEIPEDLNFYKPEVIKNIHLAYLKAGCNVLTANSFGINPIKLQGNGHTTTHSVEEYITKAIQIEKDAIKEAEEDGVKGPHYVSWDVGQIGKLLEPMGALTFDEAYESYKACAVIAEKAGAEVAIVETMSDLYEVKACVLAVKENTKLPVITTMTFQENLRTLTGADVLTCVTYLEALRVDALGFNCGGSLEEDEKLAEEFLRYAHIPVCIQPNAGLPETVNGKNVFKVDENEFSKAQEKNFKRGASLLGGCCGTTPKHIKALIEKTGYVRSSNSDSEKTQNNTYICSYNKTQQIGGSYGPVLIGERINPTGKKKCKEALQSSDMNFIRSEAESQINAGAQVLDVNVGLPGIDEREMMVKAVKSVQETFNTPLQLDSSESPVLEKALRYYNGKALVNSVNGKQEIMDKVFPLIAHYGGSIVALCIDEDGIAPTAEGRVKVAEKIIKEAAKYNIPIRDIFIDTLTLTVSSEQKTALETVKAISILKERYGKEGIQFVLGVSNISFGLPRRDIINSRFFMLALNAGLSAAIVNPGSQVMMDTYKAYRSLACYDENSLDYIQTYTGTLDPTTAKYKESLLEKAIEDGTISISLNTGGGPNPKKASLVKRSSGGAPISLGANRKNITSPQNESVSCIQNIPKEDANLIEIIEKGFKEKAREATSEILKNAQPVHVIDNCIVPALDNVGKDFESGKKFLPQLLLSADTVSESFKTIKETLELTGNKTESKGTIAIATVYGDIHDIGKNIVRAMLENYGYTVIDLGKNVPSETVVKTVIENNIQLVGLSALMTTTVANMEQTIKDLRAALTPLGRTCKIMVGGAVLTPDYAQKIGADYYSKDAMESVEVAKKVFGK